MRASVSDCSPGRSYVSAPGAAPPVPACTSSDFSMYSCATQSTRLLDCGPDTRARGRQAESSEAGPACGLPEHRHHCSRSCGRAVAAWQGTCARSDVVSLVGHWQACRGGSEHRRAHARPCQAVLATAHNAPHTTGPRAPAVCGVRRPDTAAGDSPRRRAGAACAARRALRAGVCTGTGSGAALACRT